MYTTANIKAKRALVALAACVSLVVVGLSVVSSASALTPTPPSDPDNAIPGVPYAIPGPAAGTVSSENDTDDVYAIPVTAGTTYKVTLVAPEKSAKGSKSVDFGVRLFDSQAASLSTAQPLDQAGSRRINYLEFTATATGNYYLDTHATSGNGSYSLYFAALDTATEKCPGKQVNLGTYTAANLAPSENRHTLCFAVGIDSKKTFSLHLRSLAFTDAIAGEQHSVSVDILDPNGQRLTTCAAGCTFGNVGTAAFKPSRIGLHYFRFSSSDPLPSTFSFAVTKKLGTSLTLSSTASEKVKGGKYGAVVTSKLSPKQKKVIVAFSFLRCNADGLGCKLALQKKVRTDRRGRVKAKVMLSSGRYSVQAKFAGSSKRLSSASSTQCLAVGPTGTCIGS